jgi:hypothetical protein
VKAAEVDAIDLDKLPHFWNVDDFLAHFGLQTRSDPPPGAIEEASRLKAGGGLVQCK